MNWFQKMSWVNILETKEKLIVAKYVTIYHKKKIHVKSQIAFKWNNGSRLCYFTIAFYTKYI